MIDVGATEGVVTGLTPRAPDLPTPPPPAPAFLPSFQLKLGGLTVLKGGDQANPDAPSVLGAAFGLNNDVANAINWITRPTFKPDPTYTSDKIIETIGGMNSSYAQNYLDNFANDQSAEETRYRMAQIDRELQQRETVARGGLPGVLANMTAGLASPVMLVPVGGWLGIGRNLARTGRIALAAGEVGAVSAAAVGAQEAVLQATQETRTASDTLWAIGGAAVIGSVLGAAGAALTRGAVDGLIRGGAEVPGGPADVARLTEAEMAATRQEASSVGAAAVDRGPPGVQGALGVEQSPLRHQDPLFRSLTSRSTQQQIIARDMNEVPMALKANEAGYPTTVGGSVEFLSHAYDYEMANTLDLAERQFVDYRFGGPTPLARMRAGIQDITGQSGGKLSYTDFQEAVHRALYEGDQSPIPQVKAAAEHYRALDEKLKAAAIEQRLFTEDVKAGDDVSHVYRVWDQASVDARRTELVDILARDFEERTAALASKIADMTARGEVVDAAAKEAAALSKGEIRSIAEQSVETIQGFSPERLMMPKDIVAGPRGPLKERLLRIPTSKVADFVVRDPRHVMRMAVRTMSTDIGFMKKFGSIDVTKSTAWTRMNDEFTKMAENARASVTKPGMTAAQIEAATRRETTRISTEQRHAIRDLTAMAERLRGTYGIPKNPNGLLHRVVRVIKSVNLLAKLGNVTISSISDVGKVVSNYGLNQALRTAYHPLVYGIKNVKLAAREGKLANAINDLMLHDRTMAINDVMDNYGRATKFERGVDWMTNKFGRLSLMDHWNEYLKSFAAIGAQSKILEAAEAHAAGKATQKQITYLAANGIDGSMAERIHAQFAGDSGKVISPRNPMSRRGTNIGETPIADPSVIGPYFHGTSRSYDRFDPSKASEGQGATFFSRSENEARLYAGGGKDKSSRVISVELNPKNPKTIDLGGEQFKLEIMKAEIQKAKADGHDALYISNINDIHGGLTSQVAVIDPSIIRPVNVRIKQNSGVLADEVPFNIQSGHGVIEGPIRWANTSEWTDPAAVNAMRAALHREIRRTIVMPGQDKPLWMSTELGSVIGQFHSFSVASVQRTIMTGLQQRDMAALNGALLMLGLGSMSYYLKSVISGNKPSDNPGVWAANAFDQSGLGGWFMDANNIAEVMSRGRVGLSAITGTKVSRYAALSRINALFGPTAGTIQDLASISGNIWATAFPDSQHPERLSASDVHAMRKMIPFNNIFYLRWLFDQAEAGSTHAFGIPQKRVN